MDAQFTIELWSSALNAKGQLQQAWFKVKGIPADQRGLRTIVKIGGLVGKTMAIDESTRFNADYVRLKIACRNVELVPPSAESTLGLFLYDFFFEREIPQEERQDNIKNKTTNVIPDHQPSPKKQRTEHAEETHEKEAPSEQNKGDAVFGGNHNRKACLDNAELARLTNSAPGKMHNAPSKKTLQTGLDKMLNIEKMVNAGNIDTLTEEEIIPAANYEPSGDMNGEEESCEESEGSGEYVSKINKILGSDAESSRRNENLYMARCEYLEPAMHLNNNPDKTNSVTSVVICLLCLKMV